jgi:hypothetical protein
MRSVCWRYAQYFDALYCLSPDRQLRQCASQSRGDTRTAGFEERHTKHPTKPGLQVLGSQSLEVLARAAPLKYITL